jgi:hypothetical protein
LCAVGVAREDVLDDYEASHAFAVRKLQPDSQPAHLFLPIASV